MIMGLIGVVVLIAWLIFAVEMAAAIERSRIRTERAREAARKADEDFYAAWFAYLTQGRKGDDHE